MNFIEELYYGNINPNEKRYDKDTHYAKTMRKFCDSENELGLDCYTVSRVDKHPKK